jgi:hypothetical protein
MAFRRHMAILTGLAALGFFTVVTQAGQRAEDAKPRDTARAQCEATKTASQRCIQINQRSATSNFFSAPFNFPQNPKDPNGFNPDPTDPNASPRGANLAVYAGEGSVGKFTGQGVSESVTTITGFTNNDPTKPIFKPCKLDDGTPGFELHLVGHVASTRFDDGSLLLQHGGLNALIACTDFATGRFDERGTVDIIGGIGKYAGAQGTETVEQHGQVLVFPGAVNVQPTIAPFPANGAFGFSRGSFVATFTVPCTLSTSCGL